MSNRSFEFISAAIAKRKRANLFRERTAVLSNVNLVMQVGDDHYLNFAGNDYLGLSQHQDVLQSYVEGLSLYGAGSGASSLVTGYSVAHQMLEQDICAHTGQEAALLFSSGFAANQAICHVLFSSDLISQRSSSENTHDKLIVADKFMHASFVEAASASNTAFKRFKHNDAVHLQKLLNNAPNDTLIASEGVFSMDGDTCMLSSCFESLDTSLATRPMIMLDDAHAIGVVGDNGMGSCDTNSPLKPHTDILMGTFGKAVGTSGAFVAASQELIDYLVNFARHYVYSTAIPAAVARATLTSFELLRKSELRSLLHDNIARFKTLCGQNGIELGPSSSAIQPVIIGDPAKAKACAQALKDLGIWVGCIRTPTVPKNTDRLRITLSAMHQPEDINALVDALSVVLQKYAVQA